MLAYKSMFYLRAKVDFIVELQKEAGNFDYVLLLKQEF